MCCAKFYLLKDMGAGQKPIIYIIIFFSPKYLGKIKSHLACSGSLQGQGASAVVPGAVEVRNVFSK